MRAKKVDSNQVEIVAALRKMGCSVELLHMVGDGIPDLLVGIRKATFLVECKAKLGIYTPAQKEFYSRWRGSEVVTLRSVDDAIQWVKSLI